MIVFGVIVYLLIIILILGGLAASAILPTIQKDNAWKKDR